jgi:predicted negative regulator of RcsB-dependent stress response
MTASVERRDIAQAEAEFSTLESDYGSSAYMDQARLLVARVRVEEGDLAGAAAQLKTLVESTRDPELALISRVRLARVLIADGGGDEALQVLSLKDAGIFAPKFHELRGDIFAGRGEVEAAREEYALALADASGGVVDTQVIQFKLDALGGPAASDSQEDS